MIGGRFRPPFSFSGCFARYLQVWMRDQRKPKTRFCSSQSSGKPYINFLSVRLSGAVPSNTALTTSGQRFTSDSVRATADRASFSACASCH